MTNTTADIVGEDPRITHLEKTKQDTERELARVVDELAHVRETGAAELARASDDLVGAAVEIERQRQRADAAEQMVVELRAAADKLRHEVDVLTDGEDNPRRHVTYADGRPVAECEWKKPLRAAADDVRAALSRTEAVAGRWVDKETAWKREKDANARADRLLARVREVEVERDEARKEALEIHAEWRRVTAHNTALSEQVHDLRMVVPERDAAIAARDEAVASLRDRCIDSVANMKRADAAERARDEVGIQLAAAQAEIARMRPAVEAAELACYAYFVSDPEDAYTGYMQHLDGSLAKLRAVPGDALAPLWGVEMRNGGWLSTETMKAGNGSSCSIDKAHRFATQADAEREAARWSFAGGAAKRLDGEVFGRGRPTSSGDALAPPSLTGVKNEMWRMANAHVAELEGLLREAQRWVDVIAARDLGDRDRLEDLDNRITAALEAIGIDTDNVKGGE